MEKEFAPYEQVLALKELGFDEPCFATIDQTDYLHINGTKRLPRGSMMYGTIDCPTFSQAFRWFREKYNLDSFVKHLYKSTIKVGYYFGIDEYKGVEFQMDFNAWYKTPEEAELECLKKLIEIIKRKTQ